KSFKNLFNGFGYPRFKGRSRYGSFTYPQSGFDLENGKLRLSKIGNIRIILHREIEGKIKTCTIKKDINVNASINILNRSTAGTAGRACQGCLDGDPMQQEASLIEGR
ncbi:MAG: hypothetical protein Q8O17_02785, partial [Candidatus Methanoperedens sp.]|nr:hypothetical protein [Candidatus Methanoperedens sp.]